MGLAALTKDSIIAVSKDQVACDMGVETAILNVTSGIYYGLNAIGSRVWNLIQEPTSINDVLEILLKEYDVDPALREHDLFELLQQFAVKGLLEIKNDQIP
jgi:hypothetical protein